MLIMAILGNKTRQNAKKAVRQDKKLPILGQISPHPAKVDRNCHRVRIHHHLEQPANTQFALVIEGFGKLLVLVHQDDGSDKSIDWRIGSATGVGVQ